MRGILARIILLAVFTLIALVLFLPSTPVSRALPSFWADGIPKIVLGLDLQGGMHLVLDVEKDKAVENTVKRLADTLDEELRKEKIPFTSVVVEGAENLRVTPGEDGSADAIRKFITDEYPILDVPSTRDGKLVYALREEESKRLKDWAISQALETIRNRIDKFGVAEPLIQKQGAREIAIQLPGLKDPERAMKLIGKTAVLEFRIVDESMDPYRALNAGAPPGTEILYQNVYGVDGTTVVDRVPYLVGREVLLTGDSLSDARVAVDTQFNEPYVSLTFDRNGARIFERITTRNVEKRLAIVLDGNLHSAPTIREPIPGGKAQISGGFSYEQASDLAIVLRAGALPAPVKIVQNVTVGPTLGQDSIRSGVKAAILGGVLILLFMLVYYRVSGILANFAITLNIIMLLGAMAWMNATLTLPGIAGIILTIGMGVDSNVLIFERIREELRGGKTPRSAVNAGYDRAWYSIVDSHVTTLITAMALFQFGSGPIKGFAVTLSLGILINLFTALVGTKVIFDIQNDRLRVKRLSI